MGADHAADGGVPQRFGVIRPEPAAVFDVLLQQGVGQPGVSQQNGAGEVHAARLLDLLCQQVVAHFGAAGLAQKLYLPVRNGKHRLNLQHRSGKGQTLGDAAAALQVFQRVHQRHRDDVLLFRIQPRRDLRCGQTLVPQLKRQLCQDAAAHGGVAAVHHIYVLIVRRGDGRALTGAGELAGQGDDHAALARLLRRLEFLGEGVRRGLTGGGQGVLQAQRCLVPLARLPAGEVALLLQIQKRPGDGGLILLAVVAERRRRHVCSPMQVVQAGDVDAAKTQVRHLLIFYAPYVPADPVQQHRKGFKPFHERYLLAC